MKNFKDLKFIRKEEEWDDDFELKSFIFSFLLILSLFSAVVFLLIKENVPLTIISIISFFIIFIFLVLFISKTKNKLTYRDVYVFLDENLNEIKKYGKWQ